MKVSFTVPGQPFSKQRPKFSRRGNFVKTYTPEQTVQYENLVKMAYCGDGEYDKLEGAIRATIKAYFPIPKSASKKKHAQMEANEIRPVTVSKDTDNICKVILDALNGIAYDDDRQVVELFGYKYYSDNPRAEVTLEELTDTFEKYMNKPEEG